MLLDEKHSGWEKSTRKMDTEWYGNESGYNFYWMAEFINHHFPLTRNFVEITPALLSRYDILILKNATSPFAESEIDAIRDFVTERRGTLYLERAHQCLWQQHLYQSRCRSSSVFRSDMMCSLILNISLSSSTIRPGYFPIPLCNICPTFVLKFPALFSRSLPSVSLLSFPGGPRPWTYSIPAGISTRR